MKTSYSLAGFIVIIGGILGAAFLKMPSLVWLLLVLSAICICVLCLIFSRPQSGWLTGVILCCLAGFWLSINHQSYLNQFMVNRYWNNQLITVEGVVSERLVEFEPGKFRFVLKMDDTSKIHSASKVSSVNLKGKIAVSFSGIKPKDWYGCRIRLAGKFKIVDFENKSIPGYYEKRKITGRIWLENEPELISKKGLPWCFRWAHQLREKMMQVGKKNLTGINQRFLHGMIFGEDLWDEGKEGLLVEDLRRTGTIHLLSVSGLHIGFVVVGLNFLLGLLRIPKVWRFLVLVTGVWFYILMTGMEPPVLRAGWMMLFMMAARLVKADEDYVNSLTLSGIVLLFLNPYNVFEAGFQLSFLATFGVVWLFPLLKEYFPVKKRPVFRWIWEGLLVSISAQLLIIPVLVYNFQQISWLSPLFNIFLIFPANFIVLGGLLGEMSGIVIPGLGRVILFFVNWIINFTQWGIFLFVNLPLAFSWVPRWNWSWITGYYLGLAIGLDSIKLNLLTNARKLKIGSGLIILLIAGNMVVWGIFFYQLQGPFLEIDVIDVGQGDSILLKSPDGNTALIDGGDEGAGKRKILPWLRENGVQHLDFCLATHGHRDHIGGLDEVLEKVPSRVFYLSPKIDWDTQVVKDFISKLSKLSVPYQRITQGKKFKFGKSVQIQVFNAAGNLSENDDSLVLRVSYGKKVILLTGDLSAKGEEILSDKQPHLLRANLVKVGHHGSNYASMMPFLAQIKPKVAVISDGENNRFGHPGADTLNRLHSYGIRVFRTDQSGSVRIRLYQDRMMIIPTERE